MHSAVKAGMAMAHGSQSKLYSLMPQRQPIKVEFASLDHLLDEVAAAHVDTVRVDVFDVTRASELSFVHYVTLTLYVTAQDPATGTVYEYAEPIRTIASADPGNVHDEAAVAIAEARLREVEESACAVVSNVRRGRLVVDTRWLE